jgi:hypothetical protein
MTKKQNIAKVVKTTNLNENSSAKAVHLARLQNQPGNPRLIILANSLTKKEKVC